MGVDVSTANVKPEESVGVLPSTRPLLVSVPEYVNSRHVSPCVADKKLPTPISLTFSVPSSERLLVTAERSLIPPPEVVFVPVRP